MGGLVSYTRFVRTIFMSEQISHGREGKSKEGHPSLQITKVIHVYEYNIRETQLQSTLCLCVHDL